MKKLFTILSFLGVLTLKAQVGNPENKENILKTVDHVYDFLSGKKGKERDWDYFKSLFTEQAQVSVLLHDTLETNRIKTFTLEQFIAIGKKSYGNHDFLEKPLKSIVNAYNGIAHVFQSYYAKDPKNELEGVNNFQLIYTGEKWLIQSILWTDNSNGIELPKQLKP